MTLHFAAHGAEQKTGRASHLLLHPNPYNVIRRLENAIVHSQRRSEKANQDLVLLWETLDLADILKEWQGPRGVPKLYFENQGAEKLCVSNIFTDIYIYIHILYIDFSG